MPKKEKPKKVKREIKIAFYGFVCPIDKVKVDKGANYVDHDGFKFCMNHHIKQT